MREPAWRSLGLAVHLVGPILLVHLVSPFRVGPVEPDAPVVVTSVFPLQNDEVSLSRVRSRSWEL